MAAKRAEQESGVGSGRWGLGWVARGGEGVHGFGGVRAESEVVGVGVDVLQEAAAFAIALLLDLFLELAEEAFVVVHDQGPEQGRGRLESLTYELLRRGVGNGKGSGGEIAEGRVSGGEGTVTIKGRLRSSGYRGAGEAGVRVESTGER